MNGANWVIKFLKIQQQPGYYVICVKNFHFGTLICLTMNIFLCNAVRSDQGGMPKLVFDDKNKLSYVTFVSDD